jgi:hypothetical protein
LARGIGFLNQALAGGFGELLAGGLKLGFKGWLAP